MATLYSGIDGRDASPRAGDTRRTKFLRDFNAAPSSTSLVPSGPLERTVAGTATTVAPKQKIGAGKMLGYLGAAQVGLSGARNIADGNVAAGTGELAGAGVALKYGGKIADALTSPLRAAYNSPVGQRVVAPVVQKLAPVATPVAGMAAGGALVAKSLYDTGNNTDEQIADRTGRTAALQDAQTATDDYVARAQASPSGVPDLPEGADPDEQPTFKDVTAEQRSLRKGDFLRNIFGNAGAAVETVTGLPTDFRTRAGSIQKAQAQGVGKDFLNTPVTEAPPSLQPGAGADPQAPVGPPEPTPEQAFGAPADATVTTPIEGSPSIRKVVGADGKTTYTNANSWGETQAGLRSGMQVVPAFDMAQAAKNAKAEQELHYARMAATHGGDAADYAPGGKADGPRVSSLRSGGGDLPWWAGQFEFGRAAMQQQAQQAQNAATLRGQDLQMQQHREQNATALQSAMLRNAMDQQKWGLESQKMQEEVLKSRMERGFNPSTGRFDGNGTQEQQMQRDAKRTEFSQKQQAEDRGAEAQWNDNLLKRYGGDQNLANAHRSVVQQAHTQITDGIGAAARNGGKVTGPLAAFLGVKEGSVASAEQLSAARDKFYNVDGSRRSPYGNPDFMNLIDNHAQKQAYEQNREQSLRNLTYPVAGGVVGGIAGGVLSGLVTKSVPGKLAMAAAGTALGGGGIAGWRRATGDDTLRTWQMQSGLPSEKR